MSIARMSLIEIIAPRPRAMDLIRHIQDFGSLQLEEVPLVVPGARGFLHRDQLSEQQERERKTCREALRLLVELEHLWKYPRLTGREAIDGIKDELASHDADFLRLQASRAKRKADSLLRKRNNIARDINALKRYRQRLDQLTDRLAESTFSESMNHIALLVDEKDFDALERLSSRMAEITRDNSSILFDRSSGAAAESTDVAILAFPEEYAAPVREAVRGSGLPELRLPAEVKDMPLPDAVRRLRQRLDVLPLRLEKVETDIQNFIEEHCARAIAIEEICSDIIARLDAAGTIAHSTMLTVAHAWMPREELDAFREAIDEKLDRQVVVSELDTDDKAGEVPVRLKNTGFARPFERLLQLFSLPKYGSFDPTPIMAVIFPLFFGLILGDIAYGFILLMLALWIRRRWRHSTVASDISTMGIWCATASMGFGVVFGELLGDLGTRINLFPLHIGGMRVVPLWRSREHIIDELLYITIVIGFLHVLLGLLLGIVESVRMRSGRHAMEKIGLLMGLAAVVLFIIPVEPLLSEGTGKTIAAVLLGISVILLIKNIGPVGPIEIISLVANILSYCRLMALGIAAMVLANLANALAGQHPSIAVGILIAFPLHAIAVILGILEPTIHALRLHFVEFLPKFYIGDGRDYSPLRRKDQSHEQ